MGALNVMEWNGMEERFGVWWWEKKKKKLINGENER